MGELNDGWIYYIKYQNNMHTRGTWYIIRCGRQTGQSLSYVMQKFHLTLFYFAANDATYQYAAQAYLFIRLKCQIICDLS